MADRSSAARVPDPDEQAMTLPTELPHEVPADISERDPDVGALDLSDRHALQRVSGLSTELEDVTEVEYRALRLERVILVGVWTEGTPGRRGELAARAVPAGRDGRLGDPGRPDPAPRPARRGDVHRRGQGRGARGPGRGDRRGHRDLRRRADAQPAAPAGRRGEGEGHRPDRADPGHLRPARPEQGRQGPGRAGPARVPAAQAARLGRVAVPAGRRPGRRRRRHRHPRALARRRSRPTGGGSGPAPPGCAASSPRCRSAGRCSGTSAAATPSRRWPSPATPTRASPACSTG